MTHNPMPPVAWPVLANDLRDAGAIAERIVNATSSDLETLAAAARYKTTAATLNMLVEAADNAVALLTLIRAAEDRLLTAHAAQAAD